jgi:hypothetical protein
MFKLSLKFREIWLGWKQKDLDKLIKRLVRKYHHKNKHRNRLGHY